MAWEILASIFDAASAQLETQGWKRTAVNAAKNKLDAAFAEFDREEREAKEAEAAALKEREEYEEAQREMEKERAEAEEAERIAQKEREEAEEAERVALKEREEAEEAERIARKELEEAEEAERIHLKELQEAEEAEAEAISLQLAADAAEELAKEAEYRAEKAIMKDKALEDAYKLRLAADDAHEAARLGWIRAKKERSEADAAMEVAIKERAEADEAARIAEKERLEAEEAERIAEKERREAEEAIAAADKERREYEEAMVRMQKEKEEFEEAQRVAEKERAEAEEAKKKAEERHDLLMISESITHSAAARDIVKRTIQIIPDDHPTLRKAVEAVGLRQNVGGPRARIKVKAGRHPVSEEEDEEDGGELEISYPIDILGDEGAALFGSLILEEGGTGVVDNLQIENDVGTAVWALGGNWRITNCSILCGMSSRQSLLCAGTSTVNVSECTLGGESPSRPARSGVALQARATVNMSLCQISHCSLSAASLQHESQLILHGVEFRDSPAAFASLSAEECNLGVHNSILRCEKVWASGERPGVIDDTSNKVQFYTSTPQGSVVPDGRLFAQP
mmetsp:Transcript_40234/g.62823  ORF Transcript_40234/g.62823 Transcript_40234/m.62823 type:complete len:571 (+) Transcript_40234:226-1938(+)